MSKAFRRRRFSPLATMPAAKGPFGRRDQGPQAGREVWVSKAYLMDDLLREFLTETSESLDTVDNQLVK
ncbi:hypothetical protein, partial [Bradyrhizobium liaoningense]|uniref:hypothetical protein n=1 Tax=Bradyrhizobium liaoningense TaxID=43992 RepID=UPI001BAD95BD